MKDLTTSVYTFADLITEGYLYVDKTALHHSLVRPGKGTYFLSRPRRFGKSLTLSTLKAIFQGERQLFSGLAIDETDYDWAAHPVIHFDLGDKHATTAEELKVILQYVVGATARRLGIELTAPLYHLQFSELVERLSERGRVVILIDEYDKPILGNVGNPEEAVKIRDVLKAFYSVIKSADPYLRFVMLTGVSKFSKVSVFSDLNNLEDLTMDPRYATLLGYTQTELEANFGGFIDALALKEGMSRDEMLGRIARWYNGYRFGRDAEPVYNPVSVMRLFQTQEFANYWFETGTPSFLIDLIKQQNYDLSQLDTAPIEEAAFSSYEIDRLHPLPLLVQTGYLTIKDSVVEGETRRFRLGYPNREVADALCQRLISSYSDIDNGFVGARLSDLWKALVEGGADSFLESMRVFFANIPYDIQLSNERYYQTVFHLVFTLLGLRTEAEVRTNAGRIDAVVHTGQTTYVLEFKLHDSAEAALRQIRDKQYHEKYLGSGKPISLVGVSFDQDTRNIKEWVVETVAPGNSAP